MEKIISTIFLFFIVLTTVAQPTTIKEQEALKWSADEYYNEEQYNLAIQYYKELTVLSDQKAENWRRATEKFLSMQRLKGITLRRIIRLATNFL